jgi:WD40 repeat protein
MRIVVYAKVLLFLNLLNLIYPQISKSEFNYPYIKKVIRTSSKPQWDSKPQWEPENSINHLKEVSLAKVYEGNYPEKNIGIKAIFTTKGVDGHNEIIVLSEKGAVYQGKLTKDRSIVWQLIKNFKKIPLAADYHQEKNALAIGFLGHVLIFTLDNPSKVISLPESRGRIQELAFHPNGSSILVALGGSTVYRWKYIFVSPDEISVQKKKKRIERYVGHSGVVSALTYHPSGKLYFSGDWDGTLFAWKTYDADIFEGQYDRNLFRGKYYLEEEERIPLVVAPGTRIEVLTVTKDGSCFALGTDEGLLELWRVRGLRKLAVKVAQGNIVGIQFHPKEPLVFTLNRESTVIVWELVREYDARTLATTYRLILKDSNQILGARSIITLQNGNETFIAIATSNGKIVVLDPLGVI